jgi:ABC-type phosphate/phosphonate transport system substrate-binding protein
MSGERLTFIGVALDMETRQADKKLRQILSQGADVAFAPEELEYDSVIDRLAKWKPEEGFFLARTTPYVCVVAEMLGAEFEILAAYVSAKTGRTNYHSYFVVHRKHFQEDPGLFDLIRFLEQKEDRARFVYHNQFSTSSFFLPSIFFRTHKIFHMPESSESLIAISSERIQGNSSSDLVRLVADGKADVAAVWDGTKSKFEAGSGNYEEFGRHVRFVQLPTAIPNDLLVCSAALDAETRERLRKAISGMGPDAIGLGDFRTWKTIRESTEARTALADLRWLARENVPPVTVDVRLKRGGSADPPASVLFDSARQAVRLSGTEFVLFDGDFHEHIDFTWTLEPIHDGAVALRSAIPGSDIEDQVFRISFEDHEDLTKRIVSLTQTRMHRIRYVWPYSCRAPIVIRDMAFSLPAGTSVRVQKISWLDPERNKFRAGPLFNARISDSGFFRYELDPEDFPQSGETAAGFDALSNSSYRVILLRLSEERSIFRVLTVVFLVLLAVAAVAGLVDLVRSRRADGSPAGSAESR